MTSHPSATPLSLTWPAIFELWRDEAKPTEKQSAVLMAADFGLASYEVTRQWRMRNFVPVWYWPKLIDVLESRFGMVVSYRQLVEATCRVRGPRQKDAA